MSHHPRRPLWHLVATSVVTSGLTAALVCHLMIPVRMTVHPSVTMQSLDHIQTLDILPAEPALPKSDAQVPKSEMCILTAPPICPLPPATEPAQIVPVPLAVEPAVIAPAVAAEPVKPVAVAKPAVHRRAHHAPRHYVPCDCADDLGQALQDEAR